MKDAYMNAIVYSEYGPPDVLRLEQVARPTPKENEVLIKVGATSVNWGDWHNLRADPFLVRLAAGLLRPRNKILGFDVAGRVEAAGRSVRYLSSIDATH
jgi:NADPH:quinone reductase-like Zn-dependent oxidoreductase